MKLNEIANNPGAHKHKHKVGRGSSSGLGKTSGRGVKGAKARTGTKVYGFEGGQMPLHMRIPKRGFNNIFANDFSEVNLNRIQKAIDNKKLDAKAKITEDVLRKAGLALWGSNRPSILGWWLNDSVEGSNLVGDGQASAQPLRRAAQHRGLPLRLPLADLQEQLVANAEQIEGSDPAALREASGRYGADALLAVHAREADGKWQGKWQLWLGDQREHGTAEGADPAALADAVMLALSSSLAPRYVTRPGASSQLQVQVQGMNLQRYAELARVLEPFGPRLQMAEGSTLTYGVTANREQLRAQLGLAKLQEVPVEQAPAVQPPPTPADAAGAGQPVPAQPAPKPFDGLRFRW